MPVGDIYKLRYYVYASPVLAVCTMHFRVTVIAGTEGTQAQGASVFDSLIAAPLKNCISSQATYRGVYWQKIRPTVSVPSAATAGAGVGNGTGGIMPPQVAGITSYKTAFAGRKFRGRNYIPFPAEDQCSGGAPSAGYITQIGALNFALLTDTTYGAAGNTTTVRPIVYHRQTATYDDITAAIVRPQFGVVRRRAVGRGSDQPPF